MLVENFAYCWLRCWRLSEVPPLNPLKETASAIRQSVSHSGSFFGSLSPSTLFPFPRPPDHSAECLWFLRAVGLYRRDGQLRIGRLGIWLAALVMLLALWRLRHHYDVIHVFQLAPLAAMATLVGTLVHKPVVIMIQSAGPSEGQRARLRHGAALMTDSLTETAFLKLDSGKWIVSGDIYYLPRSAVGGQALSLFLRRSGAFYQALSTRCRSELVLHGYRPEQIIHIPGSVDTTLFQPRRERRPDPAQPQRDIVCVARLEYAKGVDVLLHAWGRMLHAPAAWRAHLRPRLYLVGDGALRPQMQRIATELHIETSVEFTGLRTDTVDLLQQSWGFVLPSRWEGMPNALLEGMACGLPFVATRGSGSAVIIEDDVNGMPVETGHPAVK